MRKKQSQSNADAGVDIGPIQTIQKAGKTFDYLTEQEPQPELGMEQKTEIFLTCNYGCTLEAQGFHSGLILRLMNTRNRRLTNGEVI